MRRIRLSAALTAISLCFGASVVSAMDSASATASGDPDWILSMPSPIPATRYGHAMAYDGARGRVVLFGGYDVSFFADTWERDGDAWVERKPLTSPPGRLWAAVAYDEARRRVVLFGGWSASGRLADTWEWDGQDWVERSPATGPSPRDRAAMAYDPNRKRVVLFGGLLQGGNVVSDTWEWDGSHWVERTPDTSPPARDSHAMAYDGVTGRVVMFGGSDGANRLLGDTWEWDGSTWIEATPTSSPSARAEHGMAFDSGRGRVVLYGGDVAWYPTAETWEWDGSTWTVTTSAQTPQRRVDSPLVYDATRRRVLLFSGQSSGLAGDAWEWDGSAWERKMFTDVPWILPGVRTAYDEVRRRLVLVGREGTWEWDGRTWFLKTSATTLPMFVDFAMAYDRASERVVLFGSHGSYGYDSGPGETWEWDGTDWSKRTPATSPYGITGLVMAYDSGRGRVVLLGGVQSGYECWDLRSETWEWDGTTWAPQGSLPGIWLRDGTAMAYDSSRNRMVLFGGYVTMACFGSQYVSDTWEWDGSTWRQQIPAASPPARAYHSMAYDAARERVILFGGYRYGNGAFSDTWEWDGIAWNEVKSATHPTARGEHAMVYDSGRRRAVVLGGYGDAGETCDIWEFTTSPGCTYASGIVSLVTGIGGDPGANQALGPPDGRSVSLGLEGHIELRMDPPIRGGPGTDFIVHAMGASGGGVEASYRVEASSDNRSYVFVGDCIGAECQLDLDLTGLPSASYVRITDLPPSEPGAPAVATEIDAVALLHGPDSDLDGIPDVCDVCPDTYDPSGVAVCDAATLFASANLSTEGFSADRIDGRDLFVFATAYALCPADPGYDERANLDRVPAGEGACVDAEDLHIFLNEFGKAR